MQILFPSLLSTVAMALAPCPIAGRAALAAVACGRLEGDRDAHLPPLPALPLSPLSRLLFGLGNPRSGRSRRRRRRAPRRIRPPRGKPSPPSAPPRRATPPRRRNRAREPEIEPSSPSSSFRSGGRRERCRRYRTSPSPPSPLTRFLVSSSPSRTASFPSSPSASSCACQAAVVRPPAVQLEHARVAVHPPLHLRARARLRPPPASLTPTGRRQN